MEAPNVARTLCKPGDKLGPCPFQCIHTHCTGMRLMAKTLCNHCTKEIGYEQPFYIIDSTTEHHMMLIHTACSS
jgi:hypothetical protein